MRFAILLLAALTGCASLNQMMGISTNQGNGYKISQERQIYGGGAKVEYRDRDFVKAEIIQAQRNRMAPQAETDQLLEAIPAGGRVILTWEALTVEAGNTKWLEYIILKNGEEVYRGRGNNQVPELPDRSLGNTVAFWWNIDTIDVPVEPPFELVVVSLIDKKRDIFSVSRP